MKNTALNISFAVALCLSAAVAFGSGGQKWYCTRGDTGKNNKSFTDPSYWHLSDGTVMTEFSTEDDYYLCNSIYPSVAPAFPGGPLHLGCVDEGMSTGILLYAGHIKGIGIFLEQGSITINRSSTPTAHRLDGACTVVAPRSAPFRFAYNY